MAVKYLGVKPQSVANLINLTTVEGSAGHSGLSVTVRSPHQGNCWAGEEDEHRGSKLQS